MVRARSGTAPNVVERPLLAALRCVETARLMPAGRGKEGDLLVVLEFHRCRRSRFLHCWSAAAAERGAWSTADGRSRAYPPNRDLMQALRVMP